VQSTLQPTFFVARQLVLIHRGRSASLKTLLTASPRHAPRCPDASGQPRPPTRGPRRQRRRGRTSCSRSTDSTWRCRRCPGSRRRAGGWWCRCRRSQCGRVRGRGASAWAGTGAKWWSGSGWWIRVLRPDAGSQTSGWLGMSMQPTSSAARRRSRRTTFIRQSTCTATNPDSLCRLQACARRYILTQKRQASVGSRHFANWAAATQRRWGGGGPRCWAHC
jgi:hypothetical protein